MKKYQNRLISTGEIRSLLEIENNITTVFKEAVYWPDNGYSSYCEYHFIFSDVLAIYKDRHLKKFYKKHGKRGTIENLSQLQNDWFDVLISIINSTIYYDFIIKKDDFTFGYTHSEQVINKSHELFNNYRELKTKRLIKCLLKKLKRNFEYAVDVRRNYRFGVKTELKKLLSTHDTRDICDNKTYITDCVTNEFYSLVDTESYLLKAKQKHKDFDDYSKRLDKEIKQKRKIRAQRNITDFKNSLFLDTETTGLCDDDEIVQIGIIDHNGKVLLNELVKPIKSISQEARQIHGITNKMVENAPSYAQIHSKILDIIKDKNLLIYNEDFDIRMLQQSAFKHGFSSFEFDYNKALCVMNWYSKIWGEYNDYFRSFTWQKLTDAAEQQNINISDLSAHEAISDCEITRRLVTKLINKNPIF